MERRRRMAKVGMLLAWWAEQQPDVTAIVSEHGDRTFAEWSAQFDCDPAQERELAEDIGQGVFQVGFDALKQRFVARP